jgi:putative ABC transport system permease protein
VQGRAFDDRDSASAAPVVVIDERTAAELFGDANPIGRMVTLQRTKWAGEDARPPETATVIGVAAATSAGSIEGKGGVAYLPLAQHYEPHLVFTARAGGDAAATAALLRRTLASVDPGLAVAAAGTGETFLGELTLFYRVVAGVSSALGTLALVIALAGLFGVLSHLVATRTRELGIRLALGAGARRMQRLVLREGLAPVLAGLIAGMGVAAIARLGIQPLFTRLLPPIDVPVLVVVALLFVGAGVIACYVPARRAAAVDPNVALRSL